MIPFRKIYIMQNTYILQIETATQVCSVAISRNGKLLAQVGADEPNLHASHLTQFIEQVLAEATLTLNDLNAVAVSMGPGSYTGLRIGVSTAKGLCYALDLPLIAINTLEAMVHGYRQQEETTVNRTAYDVLVPMIDARRMEVYQAKYDMQLRCVEETGACIIDAQSFSIDAGHTAEGYILFGSGADKLESLFKENPAVRVVTGFGNAASFLSELAYRRFEQQGFEDVVYFEPYYLKDFIATTPKKRQ